MTTTTPASRKRIFPPNHAASSAVGPSSIGTGLSRVIMTVLDILSISESTSRVSSKVIELSDSESRFSSVTSRVTTINLVVFTSRTKSLSSCSILAFTILKNRSESLSTSVLTSCASVGWSFLTENVSSISLSGSEMVTSFGGNKTIQP